MVSSLARQADIRVQAGRAGRLLSPPYFPNKRRRADAVAEWRVQEFMREMPGRDGGVGLGMAGPEGRERELAAGSCPSTVDLSRRAGEATSPSPGTSCLSVLRGQRPQPELEDGLRAERGPAPQAGPTVGD